MTGKPPWNRKAHYRTEPGDYTPKGLYTLWTLVRNQRKVPVRVLNATCRDHTQTKGFPLAQCELVTLVTLLFAAEP